MKGRNLNSCPSFFLENLLSVCLPLTRNFGSKEVHMKVSMSKSGNNVTNYNDYVILAAADGRSLHPREGNEN